jgi:hypothetical protein
MQKYVITGLDPVISFSKQKRAGAWPALCNDFATLT